jgi:hypothetical protein
MIHGFQSLPSVSCMDRHGDLRAFQYPIFLDVVRIIMLHACPVPSCSQVEAEQAALAAEAAAHRAASEATLSASEALTRSLNDLKKEREILRKTLESMADKGVHVDTVISVQHSSQKMSENELIAVRKVVKDARDRMSDLHDEVAILDDKLEDARRKLAAVQEQVCL